MRRTPVIFWAAVSAGVFLLGGAVSTVRALEAGGGARDGVLLGVSLLGLSAAMLVAGRIAIVLARWRRHTKPPA